MKGNNFTSKEEKRKAKSTKKKSSKRKRKQSQAVVQVMNGDFLTRDFFLNNLSFIFFIIFLLIMLVSKGYYVHQLATSITKETTAVGDITADYVEKKAELEELTQRSILIKKLASLGLKETINPTKVIRISSEENKENEEK